jgi:hypothetical protein
LLHIFVSAAKRLYRHAGEDKSSLNQAEDFLSPLTAPTSRRANSSGLTSELQSAGEAERFQCGKQVACYLGLVPLEDSSGEKRRLGHITKQGNSLLRFLLVEAAQATIRTIPEWRSKCIHLTMRLFTAVAPAIASSRQPFSRALKSFAALPIFIPLRFHQLLQEFSEGATTGQSGRRSIGSAMVTEPKLDCSGSQALLRGPNLQKIEQRPSRNSQSHMVLQTFAGKSAESLGLDREPRPPLSELAILE